jgi:hypothetical protein
MSSSDTEVSNALGPEVLVLFAVFIFIEFHLDIDIIVLEFHGPTIGVWASTKAIPLRFALAS